jgi:XTP/dITP diphosphohydrolase
MTGRIVLLVTSPRLPAGLLTATAWDLVRTHPVFCGADSDQADALRVAGVPVRTIPPDRAVPDLLGAVARGGTAIWLAGPVGDEDLARSVGLRLAREPALAELELVYGSWDPPGARLLDVVAIMDRLAAPGGDPWKRAQTHQSLAEFLLEEAYEAYDAMLCGDTGGLREELGDVLLQVVLHARMAEEGDRPWSIDDVAADLAAKLIRRNPHVFGDSELTDIDEITANWERIKQAEKGRRSALDGIALAQPALSLARKILIRAARAGITLPAAGAADALAGPADQEALGRLLLGIVERARRGGLDAEAALRRAALGHADAVRAAEPEPSHVDSEEMAEDGG